MERIRLYIDGEWLEPAGRDHLPVVDPATESVVSELCLATPDDLERALHAAARGFDAWRQTSIAERTRLMHATARLLRERADTIARILTLEQGKTIGQALGELQITAAYIDDLAEVGARIHGRQLSNDDARLSRVVLHEPVGPVFAVSPWNLPAMMPGRKIGNSLAAGCSVILKPAKETPQTAYLIAECCHDAGIPAGVVNVVSGPAALISETMITSDVIRKVSFTGSTAIGKSLAALAGANMKKVTMELGGHAPVIVLDDVDAESVAGMLVQARYHNAGQSCMAATRLYVHSAVYERFVDAFTRDAEELALGSGLEPATDMGPLASERRPPVMAQLVEEAVGRGARLTTGGRQPDRRGYFFEPTVLADLPDDAAVMREEPFGPVSAIARFDNLEDAIARANSTPYGLAAYVYTNDLSVARRVSAELDAGLVGINTTNVAGPAVPFGGVRDSGIGREGAVEGILESMTTKTVSTFA